jgi:hypothetical protein
MLCRKTVCSDDATTCKNYSQPEGVRKITSETSGQMYPTRSKNTNKPLFGNVPRSMQQTKLHNVYVAITDPQILVTATGKTKTQFVHAVCTFVWFP